MESKILTWHKSHSVTCPLPNTLESLLTSNASCFKLAYTELLSSLESLPFFAFAQLPSFQNVLLTWPTLICPLKPSLWYSRSSSWYPRMCSSWMHPEYSWRCLLLNLSHYCIIICMSLALPTLWGLWDERPTQSSLSSKFSGEFLEYGSPSKCIWKCKNEWVHQ